MLMRKTSYTWMSLGGLLCLFGLVLACKLRDGNRAVAQPEELPPPTPLKKGKDPSPSLFSLPPTLQTKEPELLPPPKKAEQSKERPQEEKSSGPKATLEMPLPSEAPVLLPASFGPNTPTPPEPKNPVKPAPSPSSLSPAVSLNEPSSNVSVQSGEPPLADHAEPVKPLPLVHSKPPAPKAKVLPLIGTYQCRLEAKGQLKLPQAVRAQLGDSDTVLLSPGPDKCLWLTNPAHLECLNERLDQSQANEADVRVFKRLYFAQTEKRTIDSAGCVLIPERLSQFAGLHQEVVLVGIDDHFEVWDAAHWRSYTQQKSASRSAEQQ
jgi:MraZ protein